MPMEEEDMLGKIVVVVSDELKEGRGLLANVLLDAAARARPDLATDDVGIPRLLDPGQVFVVVTRDD